MPESAVFSDKGIFKATYVTQKRDVQTMIFLSNILKNAP